jgi:excisionase family DNA binding protein
MEKLLTVKEVAERLQIAPGSVYHWLSARRLTCVRLSARCVRFREKDLEALVEQLRVSGVSDGATRKKSR